MGSKDELKESDFKNSTCYYFDDIKGVWDILLVISYLVKKNMNILHLVFILPSKNA